MTLPRRPSRKDSHYHHYLMSCRTQSPSLFLPHHTRARCQGQVRHPYRRTSQPHVPPFRNVPPRPKKTAHREPFTRLHHPLPFILAQLVLRSAPARIPSHHRRLVTVMVDRPNHRIPVMATPDIRPRLSQCRIRQHQALLHQASSH